MDDGQPLHERVDALERAVTDGHADSGLPDAARMAARVDDLESTVEALDDRLVELETAVQALRGFVGGVEAVDEAVEQRANAAIARVDRLESELERANTGASDGWRAEPDRRELGAADVDADAGPRHPDHLDTGRDHTGTDRSLGETSIPREGDPSARIGGTDGDGDRDETLAEEVAARSDATLAEAAARNDRSDGEANDGGSLADRLRRLL